MSRRMGRGSRRSSGPSRIWSNVAKKIGKKGVKAARAKSVANRKENTRRTKAARERFRKEQNSIARGKKGAETRKANSLAKAKAAKKEERAKAKAKAAAKAAKAKTASSTGRTDVDKNGMKLVEDDLWATGGRRSSAGKKATAKKKQGTFNFRKPKGKKKPPAVPFDFG